MNTQEVQVYDGEVVDEGEVQALALAEKAMPPAELAGTVEELERLIALDEARRKVFRAYISRNLKAGVDYGTIPVPNRESKPTLFKPGAEKICLLMHLRPEFEPDTETLAMAGNPAGLFAFVCKLYDRNGVLAGEGRGAADLGEKRGWTVNNAVKIAEKRSQTDAVLRTTGLSEVFTQDMEDASQRASTGQNGTQEQGPPMISNEQIQEINRLLPLVPMGLKELLDSLTIKGLRELTEEKATRIIERLANKLAATKAAAPTQPATAPQNGHTTTTVAVVPASTTNLPAGPGQIEKLLDLARARGYVKDNRPTQGWRDLLGEYGVQQAAMLNFEQADHLIERLQPIAATAG